MNKGLPGSYLVNTRDSDVTYWGGEDGKIKICRRGQRAYPSVWDIHRKRIGVQLNIQVWVLERSFDAELYVWKSLEQNQQKWMQMPRKEQYQNMSYDTWYSGFLFIRVCD